MPQKIILTRPTLDSQYLQSILVHRGFDCIISPLMEIETFPSIIPENAYDGVIATSHNAFFAAGHLETFYAKPLFVVGEQTARAAEEIGFRHIIEGAGTALDLVEEILTYFPRRQEYLLYLRGRDIQVELGYFLNQERYKVEELITYYTVPTSILSLEAIEAIKEDTSVLIPFFSQNSVRYFLTLSDTAGLRSYLRNHIAICFSPSIADLLKESDWDKILTCATPNRRSFIELLDLLSK